MIVIFDRNPIYLPFGELEKSWIKVEGRTSGPLNFNLVAEGIEVIGAVKGEELRIIYTPSTIYNFRVTTSKLLKKLFSVLQYIVKKEPRITSAPPEGSDIEAPSGYRLVDYQYYMSDIDIESSDRVKNLSDYGLKGVWRLSIGNYVYITLRDEKYPNIFNNDLEEIETTDIGDGVYKFNNYKGTFLVCTR